MDARTFAVCGPEENHRYYGRDKSLQRPPTEEGGDEGQDAEHDGEEEEEAHEPSKGERRVAAIAASTATGRDDRTRHAMR